MTTAPDEEWYWLQKIYEVLSAPDFSLWSEVIIPSAVGVTSIGVAVASLLTARTATKIAKDSETARQAALAAQEIREEQLRNKEEERRYRERFEDAIVLFFQAVGEHLKPLDEWSEAADEVEIHSHVDQFGNFDYPANIRTHDLVARSEVLRLIARGDDAPIADALGDLMVVAETVYGRRRETMLRAAVVELRKWRRGEITTEDVLSSLRQSEASNRPEAQ